MGARARSLGGRGMPGRLRAVQTHLGRSREYSSFNSPSFGPASILALAAVAGVAGFAIHKARQRPPASDEENTVLLKRGNYGALSA